MSVSGKYWAYHDRAVAAIEAAKRVCLEHGLQPTADNVAAALEGKRGLELTRPRVARARRLLFAHLRGALILVVAWLIYYSWTAHHVKK